ncbi:MAG: serine/threonine-protein kinase [Pirellulaceae bacterium]|nr:serine/threonine-protein kinase [Pirellulaceae bacterium]
MNEDINQLLKLFQQITARPEQEWQALLEQLTHEQPRMREQLEALLRARLEPDSLLDQTSHFAISSSEPATKSPPSSEADQHVASYSHVANHSTTYDMRDVKPDVVFGGRYRLIEKIGEGGMGEVWVARQSEPVKRAVAVKFIKSGMDSKSVLSRFEAERQALAMMDHPNIAKVLDGGLMPGGQPFFVMELVKGVPITEFCDRRKLSPEKRLELFVPVCQAIQHAHQKGIIHRDIKPSNVLVALFDDIPVPKVIDFGIAKATGGGLSEQSVHTVFGGIVGTPQYMSPEQAMLNNLDVDTRSDVYSLGVLLYELLAGAPPFSQLELAKAGVLEILRVIREEEPPRPSAKLSSSQLIATLSANRSYEPERLTKLLRSELDWIVLKALEKDRSNRYESAQSFAMDILRYLAGEQVLAHPPTLAYRFRKVAHRNRGLLTALAAVLLAMVAGLAGTTWQMFRANREAARAVIEANNARQAKEEAEDALISGLLRPLGSGGLEDGSVARMAIEDIATLESQELKLKILDRAIRTPHIADRLPTQMAWILQACVGLNISTNENAGENALAIFRDVSLEHRIRYAALSCLNELDAISVLGIDEFMRYLNEAPEERKAGVWESLVWVNMRDNRDGLVKFLVESTTGKHGERVAEFAAKELEVIASKDSVFADEIFQQLEEPSLKIKFTAYTNSGDPSLSARLLAYCSLISDLERRGVSIKQLDVTQVTDFWQCLSKSDDSAFQVGIQLVLKQLVEGSIALSESFLTSNATSLYKVADRLSSEQAAAFWSLLSKDVSSLYGFGPGRGDAVIGVALCELGRKLSAEDAVRQYQLLSDRMTNDPRYGTIANSLQGIAGVLSVPDYPDPNTVAATMLNYLPKSDLGYVRNACWLSLASNASKIDPELRRQAASMIQADLNVQLQFGEFDRPEALLDVLIRFQDAGTELDLDSLLTLIVNDYVQAEGVSEQQVAFGLKALKLMKPASRMHLARRYLDEIHDPSWNAYNWNGTALETSLLSELALEQQEALVEAVSKFWERNAGRSWNSDGSESGISTASLIRGWPEPKRRSVIGTLLMILRGQSRLGPDELATKSPPHAGTLRCLIDSFDDMDEEQKRSFLILVSRDGYGDLDIGPDQRTKLFNAMSVDMLRTCWENFVANQKDLGAAVFSENGPPEQLALLGAVRAQKDRAAFVVDFLRLVEGLDGVGFTDLMNVIPRFKLQLNRAEYQPIASAANRFLSEGIVRAELIALADDPQLLASLLRRVDCVTDLRASVLARLEQLAFPEKSTSSETSLAFWNSETYQTAFAQPRMHFRSLRDFMLWNQARPAGERWLSTNSITH